MNFIFLTLFAADPACERTILGFPTWFKYLPANPNNQCAPQLSGINDVWLIGLALIEILTRIAVLAAIGFVLYGGIKYSASRGNADKVDSAKSTVIDALTGLIIALIATAVVSFIARSFTQ